MVNLVSYRKYWEGVAARIPAFTGVLPVTIDDQMGKKIQSLHPDSVTLFIFPPLAQSEAKNVDSYKEANQCVVFVMAKYDPQRSSSFELLEQTQPIIEEVKSILLADQSAGCPVIRIDVGSIETAPETELYGRFAGWSIGFNITSY